MHVCIHKYRPTDARGLKKNLPFCRNAAKTCFFFMVLDTEAWVQIRLYRLFCRKKYMCIHVYA